MDKKGFKYIILEKESVLNSDLYGLYCESYFLWKETWKSIFTKVGSPEAWRADDFFRQDFIPIILHDNKVIAMACHTIFDFKHPAVSDLKYFSIFSGEARSWVFERNLHAVLSIEFMTVLPNWRNSKIGVSLAETLVLLGCKVAEECGAEALLGVSVKTAKTGSMAKRLSLNTLDQDVKRGNLVCNILAKDTSQPLIHPEFQSAKFIESIWKNRIYSSELILNKRKVS